MFQVQYYDMPHREGARVETAATLGRKCWAFAYLEHVWRAGLGREIADVSAKTGPSLRRLIAAWEHAVRLTMPLCTRQMVRPGQRRRWPQLRRSRR